MSHSDLTLIYIFGPGILDFDEKIFRLRLIRMFSLVDVSDPCDNKVFLNGDSVSEIVFSSDMDYIKIDADFPIFCEILFQFLHEINGKNDWFFSLGLSPEKDNYKKLPNFDEKPSCEFLIDTLLNIQ